MKSVEETLKDLYDINRIVTTNGCAFMYYRSDLVRQAMEEYASQFREKPKKTIEEREYNFKEEVYQIMVPVNSNFKMIDDFINYWTEISPNAKKMRFEKEKVFDIKKRLERWKRNQKTFNNGNQQQSTYEKHEQGFDALFGSGSPFSVPEG